MIIADFLVDMNTADANDTALTVSILAAGTQVGQNSGTWTISPSPLTGLFISSHGQNRLDTVGLRGSGVQVATSATTRRMYIDHSIATPQIATYTFLAGTIAESQKVSVGLFITPGPADISPGGDLFNILGFNNALGHYASLQLKNGNSGGGIYGLNIETDPAGTSHSSYIAVTAGTTYWCTMLVDFAATVTTLKVYDVTGVTLIGTVSGTLHATASVVVNMKIGNGESTTQGTTKTYLEHITIDLQKATFPIGPTGPTTVWFPKMAGATAAGSGAGLPVTVANVAAADLIVVICKWEGTTTTCSVSDGTTTLTQSSVGVQNNGGANGEPHLVVFYLLSSVASGSVTYTPTLGANKTFRDTVAFAVTKPTGTGSLALDGTATGNSATSGTALTSNNQTTTGTNGVSFGSYAEFGATCKLPLVNAVNPDATQQATSGGHSAGWMVAYTSGFTGAATGTLTGSNRWDAQVISFNAAASASGGGMVASLCLMGVQ